MPWFKGDDKFHDQPELVYLSDSAVCLFWCAVSWCSSVGTDGFVPVGQLPRLKGGTPEVAEELCKSYLGKPAWWVKVEGGFLIRSFLKFNPSSAKVESNREYERIRKAKQRGLHGQECPGGTTGGTTGGSHAAPVPDPITTKRSNKKTPKSPKVEQEFGGAECPVHLVSSARLWVEYRYAKKLKPYVKQTWEAKFRDYHERPEDFTRDVNHSIAQGWEGIYAPKVNHGSAQGSAKKTRTLDEVRVV